MQILVNQVIDELVATHADVLPSSPAFAEFFSTAVRPHLLSATDIPDGMMVFIRRWTIEAHSLSLDYVRLRSEYASNRHARVQLPVLFQRTLPTDAAN